MVLFPVNGTMLTYVIQSPYIRVVVSRRLPLYFVYIRIVLA
jgi:hypothetical protein